MDVVLGASMTPTAVSMVVVDAHHADGATVEQDNFDVGPADEPSSSGFEQVIAAINGTREGAFAGGHRLVCTGITCSERAQAAQLRETLAEHGVDGVTVVTPLQAAVALAHESAGRLGYDKTAVLLVGDDMATLSVVEKADDAIVAVDSRPVPQGQSRAVLTDMVTALRDHWSEPDGLVVVGSDRDVALVTQLANDVLSIPAAPPADGPLALARGAALAAVSVAGSDLTTTALAYSQDPDAAAAAEGLDSGGNTHGGKPFLLVGSAMAAIFTIGVVSLVISLAVSIRPTVTSRPGPDFSAAPPVAAAPAPSQLPSALPPVPQPAAAPPSAAAPPPAPAAPPPEPASPPPAAVPDVSAPALAVQQAPVTAAPVVRPKPVTVPTPVAAPAPEPVAAPAPEPAPAAAPPSPVP
ncbi:MAG: hypothetical protein JO191_09690, partial [Mycobacteriaceae bacterium]|nr:hypothetical protein [Mycobacteriaceae bacterium]